MSPYWATRMKLQWFDVVLQRVATKRPKNKVSAQVMIESLTVSSIPVGAQKPWRTKGMRKLIVATLAIALLPAVAFAQSANQYVNRDYVALSYVDFDGPDGVGLNGRLGITQNGKIVFQAAMASQTVSGIDYDFDQYSVGYRHTFAPMGQFTVSASGGVVYTSHDVPGFGSASDADVFIGADGEMGVGSQGVAHGLISYYASDIVIGGGYTHYFTPTLGARGEILFGDGDRLSLGVAYAF